MKQKVRALVRKTMRCRDNETIGDAFTRHKTNVMKRIYKRKYGNKEFEEAIKRLGLKKGDTIIVHCAWRSFYNFTGSPEDVINILLETIGPEGNLLMPCYGNNLEYFDVQKTKSAAGVLSEVFRTQYLSKRSRCNHFSMAAIGPNSDELTKDHIKSRNGFDCFSPYAKVQDIKTSRILLLGLGKKPKKLSLIHVVEYEMKNTSERCRELFSKVYNATVVYYENDEKKEVTHEMEYWDGKRKLNGRTIRKIYNAENGYEYEKIGNLSLSTVDYRSSYRYIKEMINNGKQFTI